MSETEIVTMMDQTVWDKEFNVCVQRLGELYLPRGYGVVGEAEFQTYEPWTYFIANGRPGVGAYDPTMLSGIFGDPEIEQTFVALVSQAMFGVVGKTEDHDHPPGICPGMINETAQTISGWIGAVFGTDARVAVWCKAVHFLVTGQMAYHLMFGVRPRTMTDWLQASLKATDDHTVEEVRSAMRGMYQAAIQELANKVERSMRGAQGEAVAKPTVH